jgi:hypothetical protein
VAELCLYQRCSSRYPKLANLGTKARMVSWITYKELLNLVMHHQFDAILRSA